jgi:hypothetical protein
LTTVHLVKGLLRRRVVRILLVACTAGVVIVVATIMLAPPSASRSLPPDELGQLVPAKVVSSAPGWTLQWSGADYRFDNGMRPGDVVLGLGETWRLDWSLYLPAALRATTSGTHVMRLATILTMDVRLVDGVPKLQVVLTDGGTVIGSTDLAPLRDRWLATSLAFTFGDRPAGAVTWTLSAGGRTVVDAATTGVDTWPGDRLRPEWGIDRAPGDAPGYLLLTDLRAYRKQ